MRAGLLLPLLLVAGCSTHVTELIVVVNTDLDVPAQMDTIRIEVTGLGMQPPAEADLREQPPPRMLGLVHKGGPLGPITVTATGLRGGIPVVRREARVSFVQGERRVLRLDLTLSCVRLPCGPGQTCAAGGCRGVDVGEDELEPWTGRSGLTDAGAGPDGSDMCPTMQTCGVGSDCLCEGSCGCTLSCTSDCNAMCRQDATCNLGLMGPIRANVSCTDRSTCNVRGGVSRLDCLGSSTCDATCSMFGSCRIACRESASCIVRCNGSLDCGIDECAEVVDCGGGVFACRHAC